MTPSRRTFLADAWRVAFAVPAFLRDPAEAQSITAEEMHMEITRVGSRPSAKGLAEYFTGTVRIDPLFQPHAPARTAAGSVTFEPGARTAWHTHPLGQTLIITAGSRPGSAGRRADRGGPSRRRRLVPAWREALARRLADHGHDSHRHPGAARRQGRRLAGTRHRCSISRAKRFGKWRKRMRPLAGRLLSLVGDPSSSSRWVCR